MNEDTYIPNKQKETGLSITNKGENTTTNTTFDLGRNELLQLHLFEYLQVVLYSLSLVQHKNQKFVSDFLRSEKKERTNINL